MKKILLAAAAAATCFAPQAFAQATNFQGFSAGGNLNLSSANTEVRGGSTGLNLGESSQNGSVQAAYGLAVGQRGVMTFGATYGLGDIKAGSANVGGLNTSIKAKDAYSIYFEPGYAVTESTLVYGKLAYLGAKGEVSGNGGSGSTNIDGVGYGAGVRTMLNTNVYVQAEVMQSDYNDTTISGVNYKPSATTGTVGVGYRF